MKVAIRAMGNSRGLLIPKPILEQTGLVDAADLQVVNGVIEIRPFKRHSREGWATDSLRIAKLEDDVLVWPEFGNSSDSELEW
jgi:antitoxin MazE